MPAICSPLGDDHSDPSVWFRSFLFARREIPVPSLLLLLLPSLRLAVFYRSTLSIAFFSRCCCCCCYWPFISNYYCSFVVPFSLQRFVRLPDRVAQQTKGRQMATGNNSNTSSEAYKRMKSATKTEQALLNEADSLRKLAFLAVFVAATLCAIG